MSPSKQVTEPGFKLRWVRVQSRGFLLGSIRALLPISLPRATPGGNLVSFSKTMSLAHEIVQMQVESFLTQGQGGSCSRTSHVCRSVRAEKTSSLYIRQPVSLLTWVTNGPGTVSWGKVLICKSCGDDYYDKQDIYGPRCYRAQKSICYKLV
jgi:hypothetical protein